MNPSYSHSPSFAWSSVSTPIGIVLAIVLVTAHGYRTFNRVHDPYHSQYERQGFIDFQNIVFFPVRYIADGGNPYSLQYALDHPQGRPLPAFPPHTLLLHAPLAMLPLGTAMVVYFIVELALLAAVVAWLQRRFQPQFDLGQCTWIAVGLLVSPCLYSQLYLGQVTLQIVLGAWIAISQPNSRPVAAGIGLMLSAIKPQFSIAIAFLMLCRGQWKAVAIGVALTIGLGLIAITPIGLQIGFGRLVADIRETYFTFENHPDIGEAITNFRRIDFYPFLPRLLTDTEPAWIKLSVSGLLLVLGGFTVFSLRRSGTSRSHGFDEFAFMSTFAVVTIAWVYHCSYDGLLVFAPLVMFWREWGGMRCQYPAVWVLIVCMTAIAYNFLALERVLALAGFDSPDQFGWRFLTSLAPLCSGIAVIAAAVAFCRPAVLRPMDNC